VVEELANDLLGEAVMVRPRLTHQFLPWWDIGEHTYGVPEIFGVALNRQLSIGNYCCISDGVTLMLADDHNPMWVTMYPFHRIDGWGIEHAGSHYHRPYEIHIGNDVWIGYGATIMHGVTIGDGAVIGARAVVASDVRPYAIVVGNPSREIKRRFTDEQVESLLRIKWWDWPEEKIKKYADLILSPDIEAFINELEC
jgi:chloramphenicol O-acetyltransferase type B